MLRISFLAAALSLAICQPALAQQHSDECHTKQCDFATLNQKYSQIGPNALRLSAECIAAGRHTQECQIYKDLADSYRKLPPSQKSPAHQHINKVI